MTRRLILLGWAAMAMGLAGFAHAAAPLPLLPLPAQLRVDAGHFTVDAHTPVVLADDAASTRRTGAWLVDLVARTRGLHLRLKHGAATAHAIVLR
ncbi:MAG: beta-hexosaminidase, partial [Rhodanobacter sp.]